MTREFFATSLATVSDPRIRIANVSLPGVYEFALSGIEFVGSDRSLIGPAIET